MAKPHPESWYDPGTRYNRLVIINEVPAEERSRKARELICKCDCGNTIKVKASNVFSGNTKSCGCIWKESLLRAKHDIVGKRFGRLIANEEVRKNGRICFRCKCDCGKLTTVNVHNLLTGNTQSCGCLHKETLEYQTSKNTEDITGQVFGELTAIKKIDSYIGINGGYLTRWLFRCSCGREVAELKANVKKGMIVNCGHFGRSVAEFNITKWLNDQGIVFDKETSFEDLRNPGTGFKLFFDYKVYRHDGTFFLIEHQGIQHFRDSKGTFGKQQRELTDRIKKNYCQLHGITLYETRYDEDYISKLESIIQHELGGDVYEKEVSNG